MILLIEPNYGNKFPPVGLMKIATYFKNLNDEVTFYKGDLDEFVINQLTEDCINPLAELVSLNEELTTTKQLAHRKK